MLNGDAVIQALRFSWAVQGTPCGRLLAAALVDLVPRLRAFDELQINEAMSGLFRIVRLGGVVVASVMSLLGAWRHFLDDVITVAETFGDNANDAMLRTGDLRHIGGAHVCQMFRASDITKLVQRCGGEVLATSASNWASLDKPEALTILKTEPDRWRRFLEHEVAACAELGAVDGGTHLTICGAKYLGELNLPRQPHQSFIQVHLGVLSRGLV